MSHDIKYEPVKGGLGPKEQPRAMLYQMVIRFTADVDVLPAGLGLPEFGIPEIDGMCLRAGNAVDLTMSQTVPFVPDSATLERYASVLEEGYNKMADGKFRLHGTRFAGYTELLAQPMPAAATKPVAQEPFGVHISYDGNFVCADDGSDEIVQVPCAPDKAREMALRFLADAMDEVNDDAED